MTPHQAIAPYDWHAILHLIQAEFAYMVGIIDPPSSIIALTQAAVAKQAATGEVWVIGAPPIACVFLTPKHDALYVGKLAVAQDHQAKGCARLLVDLAYARARRLGLPALELQTRVELTRNQTVFKALGFVETKRTAHLGYDRPTALTFRRAVSGLGD